MAKAFAFNRAFHLSDMLPPACFTVLAVAIAWKWIFLGPNFRANERLSLLSYRDVEVVFEHSEDGPDIVGGVVKVK